MCPNVKFVFSIRRLQIDLKRKIKDLCGRWVWHLRLEISSVCSEYTEILMSNMVSLAFIREKDLCGHTERWAWLERLG